MMRRGFTLIELLLVISIVSLLAGVVTNSLNTARDKAVTTATIMGMDQIAKALSLYYLDHGEYPHPLDYGEANEDWCSWDVSDANLNPADNDIYFLDPLVEGGYISATLDFIPSGIEFTYSSDLWRVGDPTSVCSACISTSTQYRYAVLAVRNLPAVLPGITDSDACNAGVESVWNDSSCDYEAKDDAYCIILEGEL